MSHLFISYPNCSTCNNAKKWLERNHIEFTERNIKEEPPTKDELLDWAKKTDLPLERFFNTSGIVYRERNLKEKIKVMTQEEIYEELASDGMLVKRPLLVGENKVLIGFKEEEWKTHLLS